MTAKANIVPSSSIPLIQVDTALNSLRSSNFDIPAAVGELVDNALEAEANTISIQLIEGTRKIGKRQKATPVVDQIAIADDGIGMSSEILHRALVLGYSTRYDSRKGMGRFGVGATLAGISQAKRLEIYSRSAGSPSHLYSYLDLEEIEKGQQTYMPEPRSSELPAHLAKMVTGETGTLVVWSKCDRLTQGEDGTVNDLGTVRQELLQWLSRTYRHFLDGGRKIFLNGDLIEPHDPLYLMTVPRFATDPQAEVLLEDSIEWSVPSDTSRTSTVQIRITLLPEAWRLRRGWGDARHTPTRERRIHENEGLSILRANREIFFGIIPKFYPGGVDSGGIDRWFGIEVSFNPELDECFRVRNVKRGAEPVEGLRDALRNKLASAVKSARNRVKHTYTEQENKDKSDGRIHEDAEAVVAEAEATAPKGRSGGDVSENAREARIDEIAKEASEASGEEGSISPKAQPEQIKARLQQLPFSIVDMQWPGKEFIEIEHLGANTIVKLNNRHPFFTKIYSQVLKAAGVLRASDGSLSAEDQPQKVSQEELQQLARVVHLGLDLLIFAYAKAESMDPNPEEKYGDLRTQWGMFLYNTLQKVSGL
jgi:hypothetical protein